MTFAFVIVVQKTNESLQDPLRLDFSYLTHPQALLESQAMTRWPPELNTSNQYPYNHCYHLYQSLSETKGFWVLIWLDFPLQNL